MRNVVQIFLKFKTISLETIENVLWLKLYSRNLTALFINKHSDEICDKASGFLIQLNFYLANIFK